MASVMMRNKNNPRFCTSQCLLWLLFFLILWMHLRQRS